jgi:N utilization substance protein A
VEWSENPVVFVANALSPSKVLDVMVEEQEKATTVVVPDYQLSLAIGKRGQNARLAAKLTGWKIDIKSESEARELGIYPRENSSVINDEQTEEESFSLSEEDFE